MTIKFQQVFEKELKEVKGRRGDANDKEDGLPPLEDRLSEACKKSNAIKNVLKLLQTGNLTEGEPGDVTPEKDEQANRPQDEIWKESIGTEGPRNYAGHDGLIGLAFSGGGIRSSTFNLGILQGLEKCGLFKSIDYISTVSGGGFLGGCLSSLYASSIKPDRSLFDKAAGSITSMLKKMWFQPSPTMNDEANTDQVKFPFTHKQGDAEPKVFRYLRNNANYLAPRGLLDLLMIPAVLLRGVLINIMVLSPYILIACLITILNNPNPNDLWISSNGKWAFNFLNNNPFAGTLTILIYLIAIFGLYPLFLWLFQKGLIFDSPEWEFRHSTGRFFSFLFVALAALAFFEFQPLAIELFGDNKWFTELFATNDGTPSSDTDKNISWQDITTIVGTTGTVLASLSARKLGGETSGRAGKIGIFALGFLGFFLLWLIYLNICRWVIYFQPPTWLTQLTDFLPTMVLDPIILMLRIITDIISPEGFISPEKYELLSVYVFVTFLLLIYTMFIVDMNSISLHNFYRDRLSKAYLIRFNRDGGLEHNDTQKLSRLNSLHAPYHLINAAINLEVQEEEFRRGRQADTFLFSKLFIGGPTTGYCTTEKMENARPHVNLGTAMAISGAAFAATAGKATIRPLAFLLSMLNVRLNYWLPNPTSVNKLGWRASNSINKVGPIYLFNELLGRLNARSWNVDVSDGGHFENLGVYELLRRNCRLIVVGDGECDPGLKFDGVSELVRLAQVDMGIWIEMDGLEAIRDGKQHYAIGTIHYSKTRKGCLIYLKSSLLKDDALEASLPSEEIYLTSKKRQDDRQYDSNPYIAHYKANNPSFPHQTTADQFFDEKQFECYRALGFMVAMRSIGDWKNDA